MSNMVLLDTKINEIIVIKNWSLSTQQNNNHTFNTNIELSKIFRLYKRIFNNYKRR